MTTKTIAEINNIDIVDFLTAQGYQPAKVIGQNYWYHSMLPDRNDKTPSFKVNRRLNRWKDFGNGAGSTLIDLCILKYDWTIRETVVRLSQTFTGINFETRPDTYNHLPDPPKIEVINTHTITSIPLIRYLWERRIPLHVAQKYTVEVQYSFGQRTYYALGFRSGAGGYELRNKYHKYSTAPKSPTLITHNSPDIAVFEGYFDMLTFVSLQNCPDCPLPDLGVLNSTAHITSFLPHMNTYRNKYLFLDNDPTGDKTTRLAQGSGQGYQDHRPLYRGYKDLNEWACNVGKAILPCMEDLLPDMPKGP